MKYVLDCSDLNAINNAFFGIAEDAEVVDTDSDKIKMDLCDNFVNQLIEKLTDLGKNDADIESALRSFFDNFKEELEDIDDCTIDNLKDYFKTIMETINHMTNRQINAIIKAVKDNDLETLFKVFGGE